MIYDMLHSLFLKTSQDSKSDILLSTNENMEEAMKKNNCWAPKGQPLWTNKEGLDTYIPMLIDAIVACFRHTSL